MASSRAGSATPATPTTPTDGAALPWILEHLLAYPSNYEIPLRTMYTLNSSPRAQPQLIHTNGQRSPTPSSSRHEYFGNAFPTNSHHIHNHSPDIADTTSWFKSSLMSQIQQLSSQPCSLPPSFITSFVRRCFPPALHEVDFAQALTALDYLKDLETRRRKEVLGALKRLGITGGEGEKEDLARRYPGVLAWITNIENKERTVLALYTQVYIRLRYWTLINEMLFDPFNKANCIAMLNTLFPPVVTHPPTPYLNARKLMDHRRLFFTYICQVEENGKHVLDRLIMQDRREGEGSGWPVVCEYIEKYLRASNGMIDECLEISGQQSLVDEQLPRPEKQSKGRKVDSGISFGSTDRPSTSSSVSSHGKILNKPLPPSPVLKESKSSGGSSTLERIAKEIRKIRSRGDLSVEASKESSSKFRPRSTLKKMKSSTGLNTRNKDVGSKSADDEFDADEFRRQRMIWEAKNAALTDKAGNPSV